MPMMSSRFISILAILVFAAAGALWFARSYPISESSYNTNLATTSADGYSLDTSISLSYRHPLIGGRLDSRDIKNTVSAAAGSLRIDEIFADTSAFSQKVAASTKEVLRDAGLKPVSVEVAPRLPEQSAEKFFSALARPTGGKFIILGMDGIDWNVIDPMMERGLLPNLERLVGKGTSGTLRSIKPTLSPLIWTTIATGKLPEEHGILDFVTEGEGGRAIPVNSTHRKVPALWHFISWGGLEPCFVGWLASWPAEEFDGLMVSDRALMSAVRRKDENADYSRGKTYPPELLEEIMPIIDASTAKMEKILPEFFVSSGPADQKFIDDFDRRTNRIKTLETTLANFIAYRDIGIYLLGSYQPDLLAVYFESTDTISHQFMEFAPPRREWTTDEEAAAFHDTVHRVYRLMDEAIGMYMHAAGDEYNVIVLSDHGFKTGGLRPRESGAIEGRAAAQWHRLSGVIAAAGPAISHTEQLTGISVKDIAPTLLFGLGLPVAQDMDGIVIRNLFNEKFLAAADEPAPIPTYDWAWNELRQPQQAAAAGNPDEDREAMQKLKQLGYLGGTGAGEAEESSPGEPPDEEGGDVNARVRETSNLGLRYLNEGRVDEAIEEFKKALELVPDSAYMISNLGTAYMKAGQFDEALKMFRKAVDLEPGTAAHHANLGGLLLDMKQYAAAARQLETAVELDPGTSEAYSNLGLALYRTGRAREAVEQYRKALDLDDGALSTHLNLGIACWDLEDYACAGLELDRTFELDRAYRQNPKLVLAAGISHYKQGRIDKAEIHLENALSLNQNIPQAHYYLALIAADRGDTATAVRHLEAELRISPHNRLASEKLRTLMNKDR